MKWMILSFVMLSIFSCAVSQCFLPAYEVWLDSLCCNHRIGFSGSRQALYCCMHLFSCFAKMTDRCRTHAVGGAEMMMGDDDDDDVWGMVEKRGTQFLVNGQPFYVNGFNTYWLMVFAADPSTRGKVGDVLHQASVVGLTVCRTWAFNDGGWRALQASPSVYDEDVFKGLDFVVSEARKHRMRLILSLCNNWEDYGGRSQYVRWANAAGLNTSCDDDFFSDPTIKGYYKAHVKTVLTRVNTFTNVMYKDDPTIFAWELINEPRCIWDPSGDALQAWIEEMAAHVKSIDPIHLLEVGVEGFYGPSSTPDRLRLNPSSFSGQSGTDFIRNHQAPGIDFASVHIYSDSWLSDSMSDDAHLQFVKAWMEGHMEDAETVLGMPVVFGEFGVSIRDERFSLGFREAFIDTVYETLARSWGRGGSGGGCLLWQLFPEGTEYMDDGYAVVLPKSPATSRILSVHSRRLQTFGTKSAWKWNWGWMRGDAVGKSHPHEEL